LRKITQRQGWYPNSQFNWISDSYANYNIWNKSKEKQRTTPQEAIFDIGSYTSQLDMQFIHHQGPNWWAFVLSRRYRAITLDNSYQNCTDAQPWWRCLWQFSHKYSFCYLRLSRRWFESSLSTFRRCNLSVNCGFEGTWESL
jgi:hypothetical protein